MQVERQPSGAPIPRRPSKLEHQYLDWADIRCGQVTDAPCADPLATGDHAGDGPTLADGRQLCLVPLLSHAHVPHARDCDQSADAVGTSQPKVRRVNRTITDGSGRVVGGPGFEPGTVGL